MSHYLIRILSDLPLSPPHQVTRVQPLCISTLTHKQHDIEVMQPLEQQNLLPEPVHVLQINGQQPRGPGLHDKIDQMVAVRFQDSTSRV